MSDVEKTLKAKGKVAAAPLPMYGPAFLDVELIVMDETPHIVLVGYKHGNRIRVPLSFPTLLACFA